MEGAQASRAEACGGKEAGLGRGYQHQRRDLTGEGQLPLPHFDEQRSAERGDLDDAYGSAGLETDLLEVRKDGFVVLGDLDDSHVRPRSDRR